MDPPVTKTFEQTLDLAYHHLGDVSFQLDQLNQHTDEMRRLLAECHELLSDIKPGRLWGKVPTGEAQRLIAAITPYLPKEQPAYDPAPDHDGDMLNEVPF